MAAGLRSTLGLALLLCGGLVASQPVAQLGTCRVTGRIFSIGTARDTVPIPFAYVTVLEPRMSFVSDELGQFELPPLPPGRVVLAIMAIGYPRVLDTLELVAGETIHRVYRVTNEYNVVRDSLSSLGKWPPALHPDLLEHMRKSHDVRVLRLDPDHPAFGGAPDPEHRIGPWPIVSEAHRHSRHEVEQLIEALRASPYRIPGVKGGPTKLCGGFSPGIDVRFTRDDVPVDVLLCYACREVSILRAGQWVQSGDFEDRRFAEFARHVFPHDAAIHKLTEQDHAHHH